MTGHRGSTGCGHGTEETPGNPLGENPGEIAGWDLRSHARSAERNREAGRGCSDARNPDGAGSVHTAVVVAGDDADLGAVVQ